MFIWVITNNEFCVHSEKVLVISMMTNNKFCDNEFCVHCKIGFVICVITNHDQSLTNLYIRCNDWYAFRFMNLTSRYIFCIWTFDKYTHLYNGKHPVHIYTRFKNWLLHFFMYDFLFDIIFYPLIRWAWLHNRYSVFVNELVVPFPLVMFRSERSFLCTGTTAEGRTRAHIHITALGQYSPPAVKKSVTPW